MPVNDSPLDYFQVVKQIPMLTIINKYGLLEVKKRGKRWMALCPFHDDSFPSLVIYRDGWKCFGCGAYGDAADFMARVFDIKPLEAARMIARDMGLSDGHIPSSFKRRLVRLEIRRKAEREFRQKVDEAHRQLSLMVRTTHSVLARGGLQAYQELECFVHKLPYWEFLLDCLLHADQRVQRIALEADDVKELLRLQDGATPW